MAEKDLAVVVLGATGVTGRRVAAYLDERSLEDGFNWAAAGRDPVKLERVLLDVGVAGAETIAADTGDEQSLRALAARAKVVLNLVGPYTRHARPVIAACVAEGAHYFDLSGEIPFVRTHPPRLRRARAGRGVAIVQVCRLRGAAARPRRPDGRRGRALPLGRGPRRGRPRGPGQDAAGAPPPLRRRSRAGRARAWSRSPPTPTPPSPPIPAALIDDPARALLVRETSPIEIGVRRSGTARDRADEPRRRSSTRR